MSDSYLGAFGLKEAPFTKEIADADLWVPSSKQGLVDELCQAVSEHASVLLTGEPGVGKTCVLRAVRSRLPEAGYRLTYCHNATLGRRDFYRQLCLALGLDPKATAASVFFSVTSHVQDLGQDRVHPVFLIDEWCGALHHSSCGESLVMWRASIPRWSSGPVTPHHAVATVRWIRAREADPAYGAMAEAPVAAMYQQPSPGLDASFPGQP